MGDQSNSEIQVSQLNDIETSRPNELVGELLATYTESLEAFKDAISDDGAKARIDKVVSEMITEDELSEAQVGISYKVERDEDEYRITRGEDIGLVEIIKSGSRQYYINAWGGLRGSSSADYTSGARVTMLGLAHTDVTDSMIDSPTTVAVNIKDNGAPILDMQLRLNPHSLKMVFITENGLPVARDQREYIVSEKVGKGGKTNPTAIITRSLRNAINPLLPLRVSYSELPEDLK